MKYEYRKYRLEIVMENVFNGCDYEVACSDDIHKFAVDICRLHKSPEEHFLAIAVNVKGKIIGYSTISIGDLCSTTTHPREIFKFAISCNAGSVIFVHNHPSGDCLPSKTDIQTTKRLAKAGELLGIPVIDHIIIGSENYTSMREKKLI